MLFVRPVTHCISSPTSALPRRIGHAPKKQDRAALPIADGKQERMVSAEDRNWRRLRTDGRPPLRRIKCRGGRSLRSLLVHFDKGLVEDTEMNSESSCGGS